MRYGKSAGAMRLRRRTSTGSRPSSAASRSIERSTSAAASGRPAPRRGAVGVAVVTTLRMRARMAGMAYAPDSMGSDIEPTYGDSG